MTITLIRHAKVLAKEDKRLHASEMPRWVEHYNTAPIDGTLPKSTVIQHIKNANIVVASSLSRTHDSLALLGVEANATESIFNELEVPAGKIPYIKLYPRQWLVILRLMMLVGMGKGSSSLKASKTRAVKAANDLIALTQTKQSIALMGHGGMNWLIAKVLEKEGWSCIEDAHSSKNWGYKVYEKNRQL